MIQVSSRLIVTWGVVDLYPQATSPSPFYSSLLSAWSLTEVVRYGYFTMNLQGGVPKLLTWSRYSFFYVLYPVGMLSEIILIWKASEVASSGLQWAYLVLLLAYVPGRHTLCSTTVDIRIGILLIAYRVFHNVYAHDKTKE